MKKLNIALIAPPWYPVPPHGYGGIELVVGLLAQGLRKQGHRVHLFAAEGSETGAIVCAPAHWQADLGRSQMSLREAAYSGRVYRVLRGGTIGELDIIHEHSGMVGLLTAEAMALAPVVHTVHGPLDEAQRIGYKSVVDSSGLIAISQSQRDSAPELNWIATCHNAVDVDSLMLPGEEGKQPYLLVLARICPEKGQHLALEVAERVGMKLVLAGKIETTPASLDYYRRLIDPHIDGDKVVHITNVVGAEKAQLLANATALLAPITWPEPFGLSVVEAMASGTPAITLDRGAVRELVENGRTGFVVDDVDGMVAALHLVDSIDPAKCAQRARQRFSPAAMVQRYIEVYEDVAEERVVGATPRRPRAMERAV